MRVKKQCVRCQKESPVLLEQNTFLGCQSCGCFEIRFVCEEDLHLKCTQCGRESIVHPGETVNGVCRFCGGSFWSVYSIEPERPEEPKKPKELEKPEEPEEIKIPERPKVEIRKNVSGIVVCHDGLGLTKKCINLLRNTMCNEIVLVDNGSTDETQEWVKDEDLVYIRNQINLGCGIARNQGAKWATGEYLFFIDNDQFVPSNIVSRMLALNKDMVGTDLWRVRGGKDSIPVDFSSINEVQKDMYVGSGGMLVKKKIFMALGGYDERFSPAWYEDTDFCFRVKKEGYSVEYLHDSGIEHLGNQTIKQQTTFSSDKAKKKGQDLFFELWGDYLNTGVSNKKRKIRRRGFRSSLREQAELNLKDMKKILDELEIPFWLDGGTLLGAYRDKDFCEGDEDDIDLCTWDEYRIYIPEILEKAIEKGFSIYHHWQFEGECHEVALKKLDSKIDLFFNMKDRKRGVAYIYLYKGDKPDKRVTIPLKFYEEFVEIEFLGETFLRPKEVEEYLTAKYGDWKVKISRKEFSCYSSENNGFVEDL